MGLYCFVSQQISMLNVLSILKWLLCLHWIHRRKAKLSWETEKMPVQMCLKIHQNPMNYEICMGIFSVSFNVRTCPVIAPKRMLTLFCYGYYMFFVDSLLSFARSFCSIWTSVFLTSVSVATIIDWKIYVVFVYMLLNYKQLHWTEPNHAHIHKHSLCQWCDVNEIMIFCLSVAPFQRKMRKEMGKIAQRILFWFVLSKKCSVCICLQCLLARHRFHRL